MYCKLCIDDGHDKYTSGTQKVKGNIKHTSVEN